MAETLTAADVQQSQGFFLNVSNYQYNANSDYYGTWVSECIAYATVNEAQTPADALADVATFSGTSTPGGAFSSPGSPTSPPGGCATQYWNGGAPGTNIANQVGAYNGVALSPYGVWSETSTTADLNTSGIDASYASSLAGTVPSTHFVVDTSRNGLGPDSMQTYAAAPDDQPASVISSLQAGNWCNPPSAGLGLKPTADTGVSLSSLDSYLPGNPPLLDAYLWVKTPGQSDGQCDAAGGVRSWDDAADTPSIAGWPSSLERVLPDLRPALEPGDQLAPDRPGRRRLVLPAGPHPRPEREPGPAALIASPARGRGSRAVRLALRALVFGAVADAGGWVLGWGFGPQEREERGRWGAAARVRGTGWVPRFARTSPLAPAPPPPARAMSKGQGGATDRSIKRF